MKLEDILARLQEWKEKILFGVVLLATVLISLSAKPLGGGVVDIDAEEMSAAIQASGAEQAIADRALRQLESPPEVTPTQPEAAEINRPFFDARDVYVQGRASAWSLTVTSYQGLPPIKLETPGFSTMHDFDVPAGPRPAAEKLGGFIPRDNRRVELTVQETSEFGD